MLITFFENIPDTRRGQGKMHGAGHILLFAVLAILSGASSCRQVGSFIKAHLKTLKKYFRIKWKRPPAYSTVRRAIGALDEKGLEKTFREYSEAIAGSRESGKGMRRASFDGKTVRGSFDSFADQAAIQVLTAFLQRDGIILAHEEIKNNKTNEIPVAQGLIGALGLRGRVFAMDALHCQKKHREWRKSPETKWSLR